MMSQYWYPDTCPDNPPCQVEVTDGAVSVVKTCATHALLHGALGDAGLFAHIQERNQWKNIAESLALEDLAAAEGTRVPWSVDAAGVIHLTISGNGVRRTRIQAAIDARIGAGRVIVEAA